MAKTDTTKAVRITPEAKAYLDGRLKTTKLDQIDFVSSIILNSSGTFNDDQSKIIHDAVKKSGMTFDAIVKTGALQFAEKILNTSEDGSFGGADGRVHRLVLLMMNQNKLAQNWYEKVEITQGKLIEFAEKTEGSTINRNTVKRYLAANEVMIQNHHKENGIEPDHNRKVFNYERKLKKSNDSETKQEG